MTINEGAGLSLYLSSGVDYSQTVETNGHKGYVCGIWVHKEAS